MSATTFWRPQGNGEFVNCLSSFLDILARARDQGEVGGEMLLTDADIPILRGIAAADTSTSNTVRELIEAITTHGAIYIWREW